MTKRLLLSSDAKRLFAEARDEAFRLHHEYVGTEHLMLALTSRVDDPLQAILQDVADVAGVRRLIESTIGTGKSSLQPDAELPLTSRTMQVRELAEQIASESGHEEVGTRHVLLALLRERKNIAAQTLVHYGVTEEVVTSRLASI